jgi:hypothetical protein
VSRRSREEAHVLSSSSGAEDSALQQPAYDRAIRQLRVCVRVLSAVLVALIARSVIDGASLAIVLSEVLIALLLLASGALWRYGRRLEPHARARAAVEPESLQSRRRTPG